MRRYTLLVLLILTFAIRQSIAEKVNGTIVFSNDSTLDVTFNIPVKFFTGDINYAAIQSGLKFYDKSGKKVKLKPYNAKEVRFNFKGELIRMISIRDYLSLGIRFPSSTHIFLKCLSDGSCRLFTYYSKQQSGGMYAGGMYTPGTTYERTQYVLQKEDKGLIMPTGINFRRDMMNYFSECPVLQEKLQTRELRKRDLLEIVETYNKECSQ